MTDYVYYVDTEATAGDGTTQNHTGSTAAFASLSAAEAAIQTARAPVESPDRVIIYCAGNGGTDPDTTAVTIDGLVTTGELIIQGDPSAPHDDGFYDGTLVWSTDHYILDTGTAAFYSVNVNDPNVTIDGVQIENTKSHLQAFCITLGDADLTVQNCRLNQAGTTGSCLDSSASTFKCNLNAYNNILFDCGGEGINLGNSGNATKVFNVYNNTIFDCGTGIKAETDDADNTYNIENNVVFNCTTDIDATHTNSTVNQDYNAIDSASTTETYGVPMLDGATLDDAIVTPAGTMKSRDVRPESTGVLFDAGVTSGAPTTDILGNSRTAPYSIGAFEIDASGPSLPLLHHNRAQMMQ